MRHIRALILSLVLIGLGFCAPQVHAQKVFTTQELSQFDGRDGRKAYYAYEGKVYDVTGSTLWKEGEHFGLQAGTDLTGKMGEAPHGTEVFANFTVVGTYGTVAASPSPAATSVPDQKQKTGVPATWYEGRIRLAGFTILGWSGILLGVVFILNFATCFALPWSKLPLPWKGSKPGPDALDTAPARQHWASVHKYFAWATVVLGMIHGILGLMQIWFGIYL